MNETKFNTNTLETVELMALIRQINLFLEKAEYWRNINFRSDQIAAIPQSVIDEQVRNYTTLANGIALFLDFHFYNGHPVVEYRGMKITSELAVIIDDA
jgi:hypothetical protein